MGTVQRFHPLHGALLFWPNVAELDDVLDNGDEIARIAKRYYPLLVRAGWDAGADAVGAQIAWDLDNPFVQEVLDQLAKRIRGVAETTREDIRRLVGRQADEGWSIERLADEIRKQGEITSKSRSELIARTETASAYSQGSILAYEESGVVSGIEWLAGPDECPECAELNGKIVGLGDEFADGINYPPAHPACRCAIAPVVE